ncbi:MAG TPA: hypothetical protein VFQ20_06055, partial [Burkholderiaceae bacterium]|nr:hypothetical protein [Burkholderiaceae bacterium]
MSTLALPRPAAAASASSTALGKFVVALATLALLWLVFGLFTAGQPLVAVGAMAFGGTAIAIYGTARSLAWRYLFPGVAGMLLFVAFPLAYTVQIGFTNYSSANLLEYERARDYLLGQTIADEAHAYDMTVHAAEGGGHRLALTSRASGERFVTGAIGGGATPLALQSASTDPGPPLALREVIALRERLQRVKIQTPDGRTLS